MRHLRDEVTAHVLPRIKETESGCWVWQRFCNRLGYAMTHFRKRSWFVTRLMVCATTGEFDPQLDVCHTCDNPSCVNPTHLWLGNAKENSKDCLEKGRHYKAVRTHCPRGHSYAEHGHYYPSNPNWRHCKICELATKRIAAGWPEDLAYSLPAQQIGQRPKSIPKNGYAASMKRRRVGRLRTHCRRGHPLEGENIYKKPNGGRQCKICHDAAVEAWIARGKVPLNKTVTV